MVVRQHRRFQAIKKMNHKDVLNFAARFGIG
ncbi:hypothetical protein EMIT0P176_250001 [Pseudomonas sp. IT-P176]